MEIKTGNHYFVLAQWTWENDELNPEEPFEWRVAEYLEDRSFTEEGKPLSGFVSITSNPHKDYAHNVKQVWPVYLV